MSEEEIKKLSESYAKWENEFCPPCADPTFNIQESYESAIAVLEWLSKDFCIVPKSKIKELYNKMELDGCHIDSDNDWALYEAMDELEKIFPELFE